MTRFDESESGSGPLFGLHLLIVDDNRDARIIYKAILTHCGAFVTPVASAAAAVRALKHVQPDVIVTDLSMPGHDGLWLAKWLRRREMKTGVHIPIIAVTAREDVYDRGSMADVGLDDWLVKPVSHRELVRVINHLTVPLAPKRFA
ncbi:MAG: response regulator [Candidatus Rokubacteria bacterium]|nr:response regulator [Candidatus Rokubacteria bacterium]